MAATRVSEGTMTRHSVVEVAVKRFKLVCEAEANQRSREIEDLRFQTPEEQWSDESRQYRRGGNIDVDWFIQCYRNVQFLGRSV